MTLWWFRAAKTSTTSWFLNSWTTPTTSLSTWMKRMRRVIRCYKKPTRRDTLVKSTKPNSAPTINAHGKSTEIWPTNWETGGARGDSTLAIRWWKIRKSGIGRRGETTRRIWGGKRKTMLPRTSKEFVIWTKRKLTLKRCWWRSKSNSLWRCRINFYSTWKNRELMSSKRRTVREISCYNSLRQTIKKMCTTIFWLSLRERWHSRKIRR